MRMIVEIDADYGRLETGLNQYTEDRSYRRDPSHRSSIDNPPRSINGSMMKITALETLRTEEFSNVLWVRVHTDSEVIGLGETFYGAGAVEAHIHETLADRLLGRNPLHIEALNKEMVSLPMAQSSTGVEYRAASAVDIALWDIFGKVCGQPVHQMLGGLCRDKLRIYNTCAGYRYVRSKNIRPVSNWNLGQSEGPFEDLDAFMNRADALAESLLESGIDAMKIWPFDPAAQENSGLHISAAEMKKAIEPFYRGWYKELVTVVPRIENGYVYPMEGPGLGVELQPAVFKRQDLTVRRTSA